MILQVTAWRTGEPARVLFEYEPAEGEIVGFGPAKPAQNTFPATTPTARPTEMPARDQAVTDGGSA